MNTLEERLDRIEQKLDALLAAMKSGPRAAQSQGMSQGTNDIDPDIDGPRGDPEVRFVPKRWTGPDVKGQKFSACEPEFLDMLADAYEWFAQRDDEANAVDKNGAPKSKWSRLDAARARAWSARLRGQDAPAPRAARPAPSAGTNGRRAAPMAPPPRVEMNDMSSDDDIPF